MRRGSGPRQPGGGRQIAGPRAQDRGKPAGKSFAQRPGGGAGRPAGKRRRPSGAEVEREPGKSASGPRKTGRSHFSDAANPRPVAPLKGVSAKPTPRREPAEPDWLRLLDALLLVALH